MVLALFQSEVFSSGNEERVVAVYVGLTVAGSVEDEGVVEHASWSLRSVGHFLKESGEASGLEFIEGSQVLHGF